MSADELKRSPDQDDPLFIAGYEFVERNIGSADIPSNIAWHGWMVRQAFWEGARWAREKEATNLTEANRALSAMRTTLHGAHELLRVVVDDLAEFAEGGCDGVE